MKEICARKPLQHGALQPLRVRVNYLGNSGEDCQAKKQGRVGKRKQG